MKVKSSMPHMLAMAVALCAGPALAQQTWWVFDSTKDCHPSSREYWSSPASVYELAKKDSPQWPLPQPQIIDNGDEVDVTWYDMVDEKATFYRMEEACLKAERVARDAAAADAAAKAAAKAKEDNSLEKYR